MSAAIFNSSRETEDFQESRIRTAIFSPSGVICPITREAVLRDCATSKAKKVEGPGPRTSEVSPKSSKTPIGQGDESELIHWHNVSVRKVSGVSVLRASSIASSVTV